MADAQLHEVEAPAGTKRGERWFLLAVDVFGAPFFDGDVDVAAFEVLDGATARFEWRSAVDIVRDRAVAVASGMLTVHDARHSPAFADYLDDKIEEQRAAAEYAGDEAWASERDEALARGVCAEVAAGTRDLHAYHEVYVYDDDRWLGDGGRALAPALPAWARVVTLDAGGPGSGYAQPYFVLDESHALADLDGWLNHAKGGDDNQHR